MRFAKLGACLLLAAAVATAASACKGTGTTGGPPSPPVTEEELKLTLSSDCLVMQVGDERELTLTSNREDFDSSQALWISSGSAVTVAGGRIKAVEAGVSEVFAAAGGAIVSARIGVAAKECGGFSLSATEVVLDADESLDLSVLKNGAAYENVAWESAELSVAKVDGGRVTATGAGQTLISAYVHGYELYGVVSVGGADANLCEWYRGGQAAYRGFELYDLTTRARSFTCYARKTASGLFFGGYAYHTANPTGNGIWHTNTNFEVQINRKGQTVQYYVTADGASAGATGVLNTVVYNGADNAVDRYKTTFELFIPLETEEAYLRAGVAFKVLGENMAMIRGGSAPFVAQSDWWWEDLHCPTNTNEMYYIYADGMYAAEKEEA